jgi:hypothetical protein
MYRELHEEVGLQPEHVDIVARTRDWLRYEVPDRYIRRDAQGHYKGQKQIWFLLTLVGQDWDVNLRATEHPEFDAWRWHDYWIPLEAVVEFKRGVYEMALTELARYLPRRKSPARGPVAALTSCACTVAARGSPRQHHVVAVKHLRFGYIAQQCLYVSTKICGTSCAPPRWRSWPSHAQSRRLACRVLQ